MASVFSNDEGESADVQSQKLRGAQRRLDKSDDALREAVELLSRRLTSLEERVLALEKWKAQEQ